MSSEGKPVSLTLAHGRPSPAAAGGRLRQQGRRACLAADGSWSPPTTTYGSTGRRYCLHATRRPKLETSSPRACPEPCPQLGKCDHVQPLIAPRKRRYRAKTRVLGAIIIRVSGVRVPPPASVKPLLSPGGLAVLGGGARGGRGTRMAPSRLVRPSGRWTPRRSPRGSPATSCRCSCCRTTCGPARTPRGRRSRATRSAAPAGRRSDGRPGSKRRPAVGRI